jgi:hypothetical protein
MNSREAWGAVAKYNIVFQGFFKRGDSVAKRVAAIPREMELTTNDRIETVDGSIVKIMCRFCGVCKKDSRSFQIADNKMLTLHGS